MKYVVADYFPAFSCKCGSCRANCCDGWPVVIGREEYERMTTAPCRPEFAELIKSALRVNFAPGGDRYAHIVHDKNGKCRLQRPDGLCGLQVELGEEVLPSVCRLYPRNRRCVAGVNECALSLSCEAVAEQLLASRAPLGFITAEIPEEPLFRIELSEEKYGECRRAAELMGDRSRSLPERFEQLGEEMFGCKERCEETDGRLDAIRLLFRLTAEYSGKNRVAGNLCRETIRCFGMQGQDKLSRSEAEVLLDRYAEANAHAFLDGDAWPDTADRLLVSHMFYNSFPHVGGTSDEERAFYGLCTIYAFAKFIYVGNFRYRACRQDAADLLASLGRLVEHSDFKYAAARFYREFTEHSPGCWRQLVRL